MNLKDRLTCFVANALEAEYSCATVVSKETLSKRTKKHGQQQFRRGAEDVSRELEMRKMRRGDYVAAVRAGPGAGEPAEVPRMLQERAAGEGGREILIANLEDLEDLENLERRSGLMEGRFFDAKIMKTARSAIMCFS